MAGTSSTPHGGTTWPRYGPERRRQNPSSLRRDRRERPPTSVTTRRQRRTRTARTPHRRPRLGRRCDLGIDLADGGAALAITILLNLYDQPCTTSPAGPSTAPPRVTAARAKPTKDAAVIADQARIRRDLHSLRTSDGTVTDLKILTGRRTDLVADRTRSVNRLRAQLTRHLPRAGTGIGPDQRRPAHAADRIPDPGRHPPYRRETAGDLAA